MGQFRFWNTSQRRVRREARILGAGFSFVIAALAILAFAAPVKNEPASIYLKNTVQNYWTTQALYVLAETQILDSHLRTASCSSAILCEGPIMGIVALGQDPRTFAAEDLIAKLISFHSNGQLGDPSLLNDDIFGIFALSAAGVSASDSVIADSKNYLLTNQNGDGGWGYAIGSSDIDDTATGVMALLEAGVSSSDSSIGKALQYIHTAQNADGGFPFDPLSPYGTASNANSTAFVVSMIYKQGEDPASANWSKSGKTSIGFLQTLQNSAGYFGYISANEAEGGFTSQTTAQAAIALAGASYPVKKITYPIPSVSYSIETLSGIVCSGTVGAVTAMDVVRRAVQDPNCGASYTLGWFSFGQFLKDINGMVAGGKGSWWKLLTNNKEASVGGEAYRTKQGDAITWYLVSDLPAPVFSPNAGEYVGAQNITITVPALTPPAKTPLSIYYTLDGSSPSQSGFLYSVPIKLERNVTIKARAYDAFGEGSATVEAVYAITIPAGMIFPPSFSPPSASAPVKSSPGVSETDNAVCLGAACKQAPTPGEAEKLKQETKEEELVQRKSEAKSSSELIYADGSLLKTADDATVYLIENGRKRWIPDEKILQLRFALREIEIVDPMILALYPEGLEVPYPDGTYIRSLDTNKVYRIKNGRRYHILSLDTWRIIQGSERPFVVSMDMGELGKYRPGGVVN